MGAAGAYAADALAAGVRRREMCSLGYLDDQKFCISQRWGRLPQGLRGMIWAECGAAVKINAVAAEGL